MTGKKTFLLIGLLLDYTVDTLNFKKSDCIIMVAQEPELTLFSYHELFSGSWSDWKPDISTQERKLYSGIDPPKKEKKEDK